jgi:secondary thiamine-phosphate synthase enzyme
MLRVKIMAVKNLHISFNTKGNADILDITDQVRTALADADLQNGLVTIFCPSSTSAVTTIEYEPGCLSDLRRLFDEIVNPNQPYAHDEAWGDGNGHSHVRAALLKASLTVPFVNQQMTLGTWQQIIYIDFDNRPRRRELVVQIIGE